MKKIFRLAMFSVIGAALMLVGCSKDYSSDISKLDSRVSDLEESVDALELAISQGAVITDVTSTTNGIKITLSNGKSYEVTNGEKGEKGDTGATGAQGEKGDKGDTGATGAQGEKGEKGDSPVITINDEGYWCVNGVSTGKIAKGDKGDTGATGAQGEKGDKGDTGATGATGADGIYYYPCVDKTSQNYGYWVKVDPNTTPATETVTTDKWLPEGTITAVWDTTTGKLTLHNVEAAEGGIVELYCVSPLKSLAFIPEVLHEGLGLITGGYNFYADETKTTDNFLGRSESVANYRVNGGRPAQISTELSDWVFVNRDITTKAVPGDKEAELLKVVKVTNNTDYVTVGFEFNRDPKPLDGTSYDIVALKTKTAEGEVITSDYAYVELGKDVTSYEIIHKQCFEKGGIIKYRTGNELEVKTEPNDCDRCSSTTSKDAIFDVSDLNYDKQVDLKDFVETIFTDGAAKKLSNYGLTVTYDFGTVNYQTTAHPEGVYAEDNATVEVTPEGIMTIAESAKPETKFGKCAAVGKTPCIYVRAMIGDKEIAKAEMKVLVKGFYFFTFNDAGKEKLFRLNPNYLKLGTMDKLLGGITEDQALELKGKTDKIGHLEILPGATQGGLQEHFKEYNNNLPQMWDNGTIRFTIMNFDQDSICFTDPESGAYFKGQSRSGVTYPKGNSYVQFTQEQWNAYRSNVTDSPAIDLKSKGLLEPDRYVLIQVKETTREEGAYNYYDPQTDSTAYYYVLFKQQIELSVNVQALSFYTTNEPDVKDDIRQYVTLVDKDNTIIYTFNLSSKQFELTTAAKNKYSQSTYPELYKAEVSLYSYELLFNDVTHTNYDTREAFGTLLFKSGSDPMTGITWDNMNTKLEKDMFAGYSVNIKIFSPGDEVKYDKEYHRTGEANITVNKSAE